MMKEFTRRQPLGFSLLELLIVITVIGVILFFAFTNIIRVRSDS